MIELNRTSRVLVLVFMLLRSALLLSGSVFGIVIDQKGRRVAGAEVTLILSHMGGVFPVTMSDENGRFRFDQLNLESVHAGALLELSAKKEAAFLMPPETFVLGFPTGGKTPKFRLEKNQNLGKQVIQFGPPGGRLIIDLKGNEPKLEVKFKISRNGEQPRFTGYNYLPLDIVMPAGVYEIKIFTTQGDFVESIEVKVRERRRVETIASLPAVVPKKGSVK